MRTPALVVLISTVALATAAQAAPAMRTLSWPGKPAAAPAADAGQPPQLRPRAGVAPAATTMPSGLRPLQKIEVKPAVFVPPPGVPGPSAAPEVTHAAPAYVTPAPALAAPMKPAPAAPPLPAAVVISEAALPPAAPASAAPPTAAPAPPRVAPPAPSAGPSPQQARRYSLHREYGEQPDRLPPPTPVYLDNLPVSEDLAAPPPQPMRDRDERRAKADAFDPDASPIGEP